MLPASSSPSAETWAFFHSNGFLIAEHLLSTRAVDHLLNAIEEALKRSEVSAGAARHRHGQTFGLRDLFSRVPEISSLAGSSELMAWVSPVLGPETFPIRGLYFDKTPGANWKVPWHQDLAIAVAERPPKAEYTHPDFGPWSVKSGIPHVEPPSPILEGRLALRLHLDDCGPENGPLRVLPGTHRLGRLSDDQISRLREEIAPVECCVPRGGLLLMHPLLLHASSPAVAPAHRRVIHLEYAASLLPAGLRWYERRTDPL